jgi:putative acetyltransferase
MQLERYQPGEAAALAELFYRTVHAVCTGDYTPAQLDAWADGKVDVAVWDKSFLRHDTLVARMNGEIVGFADLDGGYLDRLYVHKDHQRQGVATALVQALEGLAVSRGERCMTTHASITARPFFEKQGYRVIREQQVERKGLLLTNFVMEKALKTAVDK